MRVQTGGIRGGMEWWGHREVGAWTGEEVPLDLSISLCVCVF